MANKLAIHKVLREVAKYKGFIMVVESRFIGVTHSQILLIKSLIILADPISVIEKNKSYQDLAKLLSVNRAPGRKDSRTPGRKTIYNYIKSIRHAYGDYFQVISEEQKCSFKENIKLRKIAA